MHIRLNQNLLTTLNKTGAMSKTPVSGRVAARSIEMRLLEMQRKLSAIAEIPRILSSTLATVSHSFGKLTTLEELEGSQLAHRKCSYDEDALDYELTTQADGNVSDVSDGDVEQTGNDNDSVDVKHEAMDEEDECDDGNEDDLKQAKLLKDVTPESDYESEANYATNETNDEPGTASDGTDGDEDVDLNNAVYYLKLPAARASSVTESEASNGNDNDNENTYDEGDDDDDSDFLSTTYTWNLRNAPKLRVNDADEHDVYDLTLSLSPTHNIDNADDDDDDDNMAVAALPETSNQQGIAISPEADNSQLPLEMESHEQKMLFKLDNMERSWPWADREKIIYKQSTCHLVPRKPLGLVGQRIKLLAKQQLFAKDKTQ